MAPCQKIVIDAAQIQSNRKGGKIACGGPHAPGMLQGTWLLPRKVVLPVGQPAHAVISSIAAISLAAQFSSGAKEVNMLAVTAGAAISIIGRSIGLYARRARQMPALLITSTQAFPRACASSIARNSAVTSSYSIGISERPRRAPPARAIRPCKLEAPPAIALVKRLCGGILGRSGWPWVSSGNNVWAICCSGSAISASVSSPTSLGSARDPAKSPSGFSLGPNLAPRPRCRAPS